MSVGHEHVKRVYKMFVDFDGTITKKDIGEQLFLQYGDTEKAEAIIKRISSRELTSIEGWKALFEILNPVSIDKLTTFVRSFEIDKAFHRLVSFSREHNVEMIILSDGFEFYIRTILEKENITGIPIFSNRLIENGSGKPQPVFPYRDEECKSCANCKRNHVIENSSDDEFTIYIGNGSSDVCPAQYCDFIFAKDSLRKYCEKEKVTFFPYDNFNDVVSKLETLFAKKRLKKRHQAELKRKTLYKQG
ncbi:MAG: MtnX-like HAD-IB family phosphatase [Ignavibacteriaceae bacterium]|nr:MtnX-like HAD-IB family phosphatase [Ignavibacteriaceae bacterium]